jgi:hypothetical protein
MMLFSSARDKIEGTAETTFSSTLPMEDIKAIEAGIEKTCGVRVLVHQVGGIASQTGSGIGFPLVGYDNARSLKRLLETIAHEWTHRYLEAFPLSQNYGKSDEMAIINEQVATLVGGELGLIWQKKFYPDSVIEEESPFQRDHDREVVQLRDEVLSLFGTGRPASDSAVAKAEELTSSRRERWIRQYGVSGYARRVNQPYLGFYSHYSTDSNDTVKQRVAQLRAESPSILSFVEQIARVDSVHACAEGCQNPLLQ